MLESLVKFNWVNLGKQRGTNQSKFRISTPRLFVTEGHIKFYIPTEICNKFGVYYPAKAYMLIDSSDESRIIFGIQKFREKAPRLDENGNEEPAYSFNKTGVQYAVGMVKPKGFILENGKYDLDYEFGADIIVFVIKGEKL